MFMMGLGCAGYKYCVDNTCVEPLNIVNTKLKNGIYDHLLITQDTSVPTNDERFPEEWQYATVLDADFNGNLSAGNMGYTEHAITAIRVKRRRKGTFDWKTYYEIPIGSADDLVFERHDRYVANHVEYEYALVPVVDGMEGMIKKNSIVVDFNGMYILDAVDQYRTELDIDKGTITRNKARSVVEPLGGSKYPFVVSNGDCDYYSGSIEAMFLPFSANRDYTKDGAYDYREKIMAFLNNDRTKILKFDDGRMWMIGVSGAPQDSNEEPDGVVHTSFDWTEIGDCESTTDLYDAGFIDVNLEG